MISQASCTNMIQQQLRTGTVVEENIINLYQDIDRSLFVPAAYKDFAYSDMQIPLAHGERMMTPLEEGLLLQSLNLKGHETVLEVGTGTGFLTALLSRLSKHVTSLEYHADLAKNAQVNLEKIGASNVTVLQADGARGYFDKAPYDIIVMGGALTQLSESLKLQLFPGGKLFTIIGQGPVMQACLHTLNHTEESEIRFLFDTEIPQLIDIHKPKTFSF